MFLVFVLCLADAFSNSISVIFYHVCASGTMLEGILLLYIFLVMCAFRRLYEVQLRVLLLGLVVALSNSISEIYLLCVVLFYA